MTSSERQALLFLGVVTLLGLGARVVRSRGTTPAATVETRRALLRQIAAVDSARSAKGEKKGKGSAKGSAKGNRRRDSSEARVAALTSAASPPIELPGTSVYGELLATGAPTSSPRPTSQAPHPRLLDIDRATIEELESLPGVGPLLAHRIAEERAKNGTFGGLEALDERVKGVGPALAKRLAPHVTFSGPRRPTSAAVGVLSPPGRTPRGHRSPRPSSRAP
jgi:competence protein ComEA